MGQIIISFAQSRNRYLSPHLFYKSFNLKPLANNNPLLLNPSFHGTNTASILQPSTQEFMLATVQLMDNGWMDRAWGWRKLGCFRNHPTLSLPARIASQPPPTDAPQVLVQTHPQSPPPVLRHSSQTDKLTNFSTPNFNAISIRNTSYSRSCNFHTGLWG